MGINLDFAPVADVLATRSTVIGSRSFGADPKQAAAQVGGAVRGLQAAGVAATLKHFPGHGHSADDSHQTCRCSPSRRGAAGRGAWPPFHRRHRRRGDGGDVRAPGRARDRPGVPATFSRKLLTDVLRGQLGFTGRGDHRRDEHGAREALAARRGGGPGAQRRQRPDPDAAERRSGVRRAARRAARRDRCPGPGWSRRSPGC